MPYHTKREDQHLCDMSRQGTAAHAKGGARRTARIIPLMAALPCALAVNVSGCAGNGDQPKTDEAAKTAEAQASEKAAEEARKAEEATRVTAGKATAEKATEEKAAAEKAEAERIAAEKAEAERIEAEHQQLREEAIANGEQVFEGTIILGNGAETAEMLNNTMALTSNGSAYKESEEKSSYAMLALDSSQPVYITGFSGGPTTRNASFIQLGKNDFNQSSNSYRDIGYSNWEPYGYEHVCVAVSNCWVSEGVAVVLEPVAQQARLLYVVE